MEEMIGLMEQTANMLRGMTLDPRIPDDTKEVMRNRYAEIEALLEGYAEVLPGGEDD